MKIFQIFKPTVTQWKTQPHLPENRIKVFSTHAFIEKVQQIWRLTIQDTLSQKEKKRKNKRKKNFHQPYSSMVLSSNINEKVHSKSNLVRIQMTNQLLTSTTGLFITHSS